MRAAIIPCLALLTAACLTRPVGDLPGDEESSGGRGRSAHPGFENVGVCIIPT